MRCTPLPSSSLSPSPLFILALTSPVPDLVFSFSDLLNLTYQTTSTSTEYSAAVQRRSGRRWGDLPCTLLPCPSRTPSTYINLPSTSLTCCAKMSTPNTMNVTSPFTIGFAMYVLWVLYRCMHYRVGSVNMPLPNKMSIGIHAAGGTCASKSPTVRPITATGAAERTARTG